MELDRVSKETILSSIKDAIPSRWPRMVEELRLLAKEGDISLRTFLDETGIELDDVYASKRSWSDLREAAGLSVHAPGEYEAPFRRAIGRLLHVDDAERLTRYASLLRTLDAKDLNSNTERVRRYARMLVAQLGDKVLAKQKPTLEEGWDRLRQHPQVCAEVAELMELLAERTDHLHATLDSRPDVPLLVHARYSRIEILAAFGDKAGANVAAWQTGVRWLEKQKADLFAFTLDKTSGSFSPTTRYRDYAISRELIHWESQGATREDSETGRRYRTHVQLGSEVHLFARLRDDERAFWFLGPATFVSSRGERPMSIIWKLQHQLPGDLFAKFAAAVA
jgi:hypothetical protein